MHLLYISKYIAFEEVLLFPLFSYFDYELHFYSDDKYTYKNTVPLAFSTKRKKSSLNSGNKTKQNKIKCRIMRKSCATLSVL